MNPRFEVRAGHKCSVVIDRERSNAIDGDYVMCSCEFQEDAEWLSASMELIVMMSLALGRPTP
jgi:hypothetical protein